MMDIQKFIKDLGVWSDETFGPPEVINREWGIIDHIKLELGEVEDAEGADKLAEWVDVITLALDGARRAGFSPDQISIAMIAKLDKNKKRSWPDWRDQSPDEAIEHVREDAKESLDMKVGDCVNYHHGIGGPVTLEGRGITKIEFRDGVPMVKLKGENGWWPYRKLSFYQGGK